MATKNKKNTTADLKPLSAKVLAGMRQVMNAKIVDMSQWKKAEANADALAQATPSLDSLSDLDPTHAVYVHALNTMGEFVESVCQLPAMAKLTDKYGQSEDEYMPYGPPESPLTRSYFSCWGFLDLSVGKARESFASIVIDLCRELQLESSNIQVYQQLANSRMGFYVHEGFNGDYIKFRELITNNKINAICPAGYKGQTGEIWLARILPPPFEGVTDYWIVFTTPYILGEISPREYFSPDTEERWLAFFDRNLKKTNIPDRVAAYTHLMKYGLNTNYWNEYIFLSYVNHQSDRIFSAGYPDIAKSMPQSEEYLMLESD